jgi:hypothetical protein
MDSNATAYIAEIEKVAVRTRNVIALADQIHERPLSKP